MDSIQVDLTQEIGQLVTAKSNDELLAMLAQPDDWQPQMLDAAKAQLQQRGFEFIAAAPKALASDPEFDELQRVANYRVLQNLRKRGFGSIGWGLFAIALGLTFMEDSRVNGILAVIGLFLTVEGIWLVLAPPSPRGLLVDGFAVLIVGIWNIAVTVVATPSLGEPSPPFEPSPLFGILGLLQIGWASQSFVKYSRSSKMSNAKPSTETLQRLDQLVNYMKEANMMSDPALIVFVTNGQMGWKGQLGKTGAIFAAQQVRKHSNGLGTVRDLIFAAKQDVSFRSTGDGLAPMTLKVTFTIKNRKSSSGVMPLEAFQRFEAWRVGIKKRPDAD